MKTSIKFLSFLLCFAMILCCFAGCNKKGNENGEFVIPKDLMTEEGYRTALKDLLAGENFITADDAYLSKVNTLGDKLEEMIRYNTEDVSDIKGTTYYVSNEGDDKNDGKTPETAWATLEKLDKFAAFKEGDAVLFRRGDTFRGNIFARSGVTYAAYGEGHKPKLYASVDGKTYGEWKETDTKNVWVLEEKILTKDINCVVFGYDNDAPYATKEFSIKKLNRNLEFCFQGASADDGRIDYKLYLYCDEGNPNDVYDIIEISLQEDMFEMAPYAKDITIRNLEIVFGSNPYFFTGGKNIVMEYCVCGWMGGGTDANGVRLGGGAGAWLECDNLVYDHCYFYQQFDSGVTPQYDYEDKTPSIFKNFITTDCLFETTEYTLEYFNTQENTLENRFENMYFGYNFCREGGAGFGTKASQSAYIKSWGHENTCINSTIEYNVFDRATSYTLQINGFEQKATGNVLSYKFIPKMQNNIYLQIKNKKFAEINKVDYKFNEQAYNDLKSLGVETGALYVFTEKETKK